MARISRFPGFALSTVLAAWFVTATLYADRVDDYIEQYVGKQTPPGVSVAVVRDGKVEKAAGYGFADVELKVPATEHTVYQWASVTKQFTAAAILMLVQDGKLSLSDHVSQYYAKSPAAWSNVTIRHLLTHTSGIKSYTDQRNFWKTIRKDYEPDELVALITEEQLDFEPGEKWHYNNTAYFLLGLIVEKVSGKTYGEFLHDRIFKPAGMDTARVNDQFELIPNRATGYELRSNVLRRAEFVSPTQPFSAGALVGTVLDLAKWDAALYSDKLLPESVRKEMWTAVKLNDGKPQPYGYGWQLGERRGHRWVGHGGGIQGFSTFILRMPDDKLTVIALCNGPANPQQFAQNIAAQYISGLSLASVSPKTDPHPELSKKLEACLREMAEKKDSEMLTPEFREDFSRSRRRFGALKDDMKAMKSFTFVVEEKPESEQRLKVPVKRAVSYKLITAGDASRFYTLDLTADNKIAWFQAED